MYQTPDMALAVALLHAGESLSKILPIAGDTRGKVKFCFAETESLPDTLERAWRKDITAPVQSVIHTTRLMKTKIKYVQRENSQA